MKASPNSEFRVCVFEVAGERFGLRLDALAEVVPMAALSCPASMPPILEGFLNLRGTAYPVVKLARLLTLAEDPLGLHTPLLITRAHPPLALLVNRVTGIATVSADSLLPILESDSFNGSVAGQLTLGREAVHLLSLDRLLLEKERQVVSDFQAVEASRLLRIGQ